MTPELECYLVKAQAALGTVEDTLTGAANFFPATPDSKVEVIPSFTDIETVSAGFDQDASVRGFVNSNIQLGCYIRSLGNAADTTPPDFGLLARACGMSETPTLVNAKYKYIYTPSAAFTTEDLTVWHYTGAIGASASLLRKVGNVVGNWKISADTGKPVKFEMTGGKGIYTSEAAGTLPTPTKSRLAIPATVPLTVVINGNAYNVIKFEIDGGNSVDQNILASDSYGYGISEITKKKVKFNFTCMADVALTFPMSTVIAGLVASSFTLTYGPAGYKVEIAMAYPQFLDCKQGASNNLTTWEISGIATRDAVTITVNSDIS
jgi:hypothetical protein